MKTTHYFYRPCNAGQTGTSGENRDAKPLNESPSEKKSAVHRAEQPQSVAAHEAAAGPPVCGELI